MTHNCTYLICIVLPCETVTTVKITNIVIISSSCFLIPLYKPLSPNTDVFYHCRLVVVFCRLSHKLRSYSVFSLLVWLILLSIVHILACIIIHSFLLWNNISVYGHTTGLPIHLLIEFWL